MKFNVNFKMYRTGRQKTFACLPAILMLTGYATAQNVGIGTTATLNEAMTSMTGTWSADNAFTGGFVLTKQ